MGLPCERARHKPAAKQREKRFLENQPAPGNLICKNKTATTVTTQSTIIIDAAAANYDNNNDDEGDSNRNYQQFYESPPKYKNALKRTPQNLTSCRTTTDNSCCSRHVAILSRLTQLICNFPLSYKSGSTASAAAGSTTTTYSHNLVRHSLCLYAASSVLLALCYLTTPAASETNHTIFE